MEKGRAGRKRGKARGLKDLEYQGSRIPTLDVEGKEYGSKYIEIHNMI